jgi:hypothetical protein
MPRAPFTTKLAPVSGWNSAATVRSDRDHAPMRRGRAASTTPPPTDVSRIAHAEPLNSGNDIGNGSSVCESKKPTIEFVGLQNLELTYLIEYV